MTYRVLALAMILLAIPGCYSSQQIKPTELPKLNHAFATPVASSGGQVLAVRVAQVEKPDGTLTEVAGEFDVELTLRRGEKLVFDHPVRASLEGESLTIAGGNRRSTAFRLADITEVRVTQFQSGKTLLAIYGVGSGIMLIVLLSIL
ncbi:MAG: hypothetical protein RJA70_1412 [Pseudomonadota bacterium]|jgi:hypothetical protein